MRQSDPDIDFAIEVFVRGHAAVRSRTHPYDVARIGPLWVMRDAPRRNPRDYRKEEWITHGVEPGEAHAIARREAHRRYFLCDLVGEASAIEPTRDAYKALGYRLLATEGFFVHPLARIPRSGSPARIERVHTAVVAARLASLTRTRPIAEAHLGDDAPFRQYVALEDEAIVGRVRSVNAAGAAWCTDMYVAPANRRRGVGRALLERMLRDDRSHGARCSVLAASHTGALLYPHLGYVRLATLLMLAPRRSRSA